MARTARIVLDGKEYEVHAFNMKELQEVGAIIGNGDANIVSGMRILGIAMRRATPPISAEDYAALEPTMAELNEATTQVLKLSGLNADANPQTAAPAGN